MRIRFAGSGNPVESGRVGRHRDTGRRLGRIRGVAALLLVVLVVAGCAGEGEEPAAPQESASAVPDGPAEQDAPEQDQDALGADPDDSDSGEPDDQHTPGGPSSPAAAPGGGDIYTEVAAEDQEFLPAVDLGTETEVGDVATVTILDLARADVEARTAGEISGPGIIVSVRLSNDSDEQLDLGWVTVNAEDADDVPLSPMGGPPADPFFGPLAIGSSAEATYVFRLPEDVATPLTVTVNPVPDVAVAVFTGDPS